MRLVRSRANEWSINPQSIGVMGFSAGGHLASTVITQLDGGDPDATDPVAKISARPDFSIINLDDGDRVVGAAVVDEAQLPVGEALDAHRFDGVAQHLRIDEPRSQFAVRVQIRLHDAAPDRLAHGRHACIQIAHQPLDRHRLTRLQPPEQDHVAQARLEMRAYGLQDRGLDTVDALDSTSAMALGVPVMKRRMPGAGA